MNDSSSSQADSMTNGKTYKCEWNNMQMDTHIQKQRKQSDERESAHAQTRRGKMSKGSDNQDMTREEESEQDQNGAPRRLDFPIPRRSFGSGPKNPSPETWACDLDSQE
mmetsp:Transcript_144415/g.462738  ORF Transcript_144415/g.462738 Transcript_144415/m.462738 type:complete len:109 (-) Transcript_144415:318-644(-)